MNYIWDIIISPRMEAPKYGNLCTKTQVLKF